MIFYIVSELYIKKNLWEKMLNSTFKTQYNATINANQFSFVFFSFKAFIGHHRVSVTCHTEQTHYLNPHFQQRGSLHSHWPRTPPWPCPATSRPLWRTNKRLKVLCNALRPWFKYTQTFGFSRNLVTTLSR